MVTGKFVLIILFRFLYGSVLTAFGMLSTINVCVRWGSNKTLTETTRQQIESQHTKLYNYWFRWLSGHDNFPFEEVKINYIGWAVRDRVQLQGSLDGLNVYTGYTDERGDLDCNPACSVEKHLDGDFSDCPGGRDHRYHQFLFLNPAWGEYNMGAAMGYGIEVSFHGWETVGSKMGDWPLLLHEMVKCNWRRKVKYSLLRIALGAHTRFLGLPRP